MRGRPLLEWAVFTAVWALLLIPLFQIAGGSTGSVEPDAADLRTATDQETVWLRLAFSEAPESLIVYSAGTEIWRAQDLSDDVEQLVALGMDDGTPDLEIEATWSTADRRATAVDIEPIEGKASQALLWSESKTLRERIFFK